MNGSVTINTVASCEVVGIGCACFTAKAASPLPPPQPTPPQPRTVTIEASRLRTTSGSKPPSSDLIFSKRRRPICQRTFRLPGNGCRGATADCRRGALEITERPAVGGEAPASETVSLSLFFFSLTSRSSFYSVAAKTARRGSARVGHSAPTACPDSKCTAARSWRSHTGWCHGRRHHRGRALLALRPHATQAPARAAVARGCSLG